MGDWLASRVGLVRARQLIDRLRHRLSFIPGVYVVVMIIGVQVSLALDRRVDPDALPEILTTTVDSARSVLGALAGGLITSTTLILSMMLITVQLAGDQYSPRTLRDWLGNRTLQHTIGLALGTTIFCLLALRSARTLGEGDQATAITPNITVIVAVALGVLSLFAVVRSVDHVTHSVRIGSVSRRIATDTIAIINASESVRSGQRPRMMPASQTDGATDFEIPDDAVAVVAPAAGWVQQIDAERILDALPSGSTGYLVATLGGFVPQDAPMLWISPPAYDLEACSNQCLEAFATGDGRTLQQDVGFGLVQLTDIAVRALSPGVNDPSTANDIVVQLGNVMIHLWSHPTGESRVERDGRTLLRRRPEHGEMLGRAFEPIRRYGADDPTVLATMARVLDTVRSEVIRRGLPGPVAPIDELINEIGRSARREGWSASERRELDRLVGT